MNPENENGVQDPNKAATQPASAAPATPLAQAEATPAATAPAAQLNNLLNQLLHLPKLLLRLRLLP